MHVIIAARLSRKGTRGDDHGLGIETQDERSREWARREGHEVVAVVADHKSGTVAPQDRKNLRPWVTDPVKMALYDGIVAYKNDRLSRGGWGDEARIRQWAEANGKTLMIVNGPQWPPRDDGDEWAWEAMSKMARKEWEAIRERSMRAVGELNERGKLTNRPPWGYRSIGDKYDHHMEPTDEGRRYIPAIFARVISGQSLATVAQWLNEQTGGRPFTDRTVPWYAKTVGTIIRNPAYRGEYSERDGKSKRYGKVLLEVEPLVDARTFRLANEALDNRPKRGPVDEDNRAMLAGALYCARSRHGDTPVPMYRHWSGDGASRRATYYCKRGDRAGCGNMVLLATVDAAVDEIIRDEYADVPVEAETIIPGNADEIDNRRQKIRYQIRNTGDLLATSEISDGEYDQRMGDLRAALKRVDATKVITDHVDVTKLDETYAQRWASMPVNERGPWLRDNGFTVLASKQAAGTVVTVIRGGKTDTAVR